MEQHENRRGAGPSWNGLVMETTPARTELFDADPAPLAPRRMGSGIPRLDTLLGGGYPCGSAILLHGPPFCGKQQLMQEAIVHAVGQGLAVTVVLHTQSATDLAARLCRIDPEVGAAEVAGRLRYVDASSHLLGEPKDHPNATYITDPANVESLQQACGAISDLLVVESVSTLMVDMGTPQAFAFLRAVLGGTIRSGGVALLSMHSDMHAPADAELTKQLCTGMVELVRADHSYRLRIDGVPGQAPSRWIDYKFGAADFSIL